MPCRRYAIHCYSFYAPDTRARLIAAFSLLFTSYAIRYLRLCKADLLFAAPLIRAALKMPFSPDAPDYFR